MSTTKSRWLLAAAALIIAAALALVPQTANAAQAESYTFYAYDADAADGKDAGTYLAVDEEGVSPGTYEIAETNGQKVLTFHSDEIDVSYVARTQKLDGSLTVKTAPKNYRVKALKKKKASFQIGAKAPTALTYKVANTPKGAKKYISVSKTGKVTLKKGAKKGTYKITVSAAESAVYKAASKTVTIKVK